MKRVISAAVLIPIIIYVVLYTPGSWLCGVTFLATLVALREYNAMLPGRGGWMDAVVWALPGAFVPVVAFAWGPGYIFPVLFAFLLYAFVGRIFSGAPPEGSAGVVSARILGIVYVALPLAHIMLLSEVEHGRWWVLFVFVVVWLNDTCAYYGGRALGKNKLAPVLSPKKTVEGAVSGLVGGAVAALIYVYAFSMEMGFLLTIVSALAVGVAAILGDLSESLLKRSAGVKDSGTLIPGHGGLLDRIDSLLFAVPVLYYIILISGPDALW